MKKFFEAFEQAEVDRALGTATAAVVVVSEDTPAAPQVLEPAVWSAQSEPIDAHLVSLLKPSSPEAEHYRTLRHLVEQAHRTVDLSVIGITSPGPRDGKTVTAINLAGALAQAPGTRVLLIDLDLRKPSVAHRLGIEGADDEVIRALLNPELTLDDVVRTCPPFNLAALASRRPVSATYELLKSSRCGELITAAREQYDYVVLDLPPLIPLPDCRIVEKWIDGFLVVVAAHTTPRKMLNEGLAAVDPAKVAGLVFNGDDGPLSGYAYGSGADEARWWRRMVALKRTTGPTDEVEETAWWRRMATRGQRRLGRKSRAKRTRSPLDG
jgi:Mrp family chromosome partitioning ATPase